MNPLYYLLILAAMAGGAAIGFRFSLRHNAKKLAQAARDPARNAFLLGCACFLGATFAQDVLGALRPLASDAVLVKYFFGAIIGVGHYLVLRRIAIRQAA